MVLKTAGRQLAYPGSMRNTDAISGKPLLRRFVSLVRVVLRACSSAWLALLARYQRRAQRYAADLFLGRRSHERLLRWLLALGAIMLGLFVIYALFGVPF